MTEQNETKLFSHETMVGAVSIPFHTLVTMYVTHKNFQIRVVNEFSMIEK